MANYPSIPSPTNDPNALLDSVMALKQGFEILSGQKGVVGVAAVTNAALAAALAGLPASGATPTSGAPFDAESYNNLTLNGGMEVDQEHAGAAVTVASGYVVDGWLVAKNGTMVATAQQVADAPPGFSNSLKVTVGTAEASLGAGDFIRLYQLVEGFLSSRLQFGTATPLSVTLGFWTKIHRTGVYSGALSNAAVTRSYPFTFTQNVADTWEYKTVTIPGDQTGAWIGNTNGVGLQMGFVMASGATYQSTAGSWVAGNAIAATGTTNGVAATSDVFQVTGVCLLPGAIAASAAASPLIKRPFGQELALCQRSYEKSFPLATAPAQNSGSNTGAVCMSQPVGAAAIVDLYTVEMKPKRVAPTVILYNPAAANAQIRNISTGTDWTSSGTTFISEFSFLIFGTTPGGSTAGQGMTVHWTADARL